MNLDLILEKTLKKALLLILLFAFSIVSAKAVTSDYGYISLNKNWKKVSERKLKKSTLEAQSGKTQIALYPVFNITTLKHLAEQLKRDRAIVINSMARPSSIKKIELRDRTYYYFAWQKNTMGYFATRVGLFHLVG
jgi:hypothetical protein